MKRLAAICFVILVVLSVFPLASPAQSTNLNIATFNCKFLTRPKVHAKFSLKLNLSKGPAAVREEWNQPGHRDQKFNEAAKEVAKVIHSINADVIALTEVGDATDVAELQSEIAALGLDYAHSEVCISSDDTTKQHVALLSKFPLSDILREIPGRESYLEEMDDAETEKDTGISKGMRVMFAAYGREFLLYVIHLASELGGHEKDQQRIAQASIFSVFFSKLLGFIFGLGF